MKQITIKCDGKVVKREPANNATWNAALKMIEKSGVPCYVREYKASFTKGGSFYEMEYC